jgi:hypothetical protein
MVTLTRLRGANTLSIDLHLQADLGGILISTCPL